VHLGLLVYLVPATEQETEMGSDQALVDLAAMASAVVQDLGLEVIQDLDPASVVAVDLVDLGLDLAVIVHLDLVGFRSIDLHSENRSFILLNND